MNGSLQQVRYAPTRNRSDRHDDGPDALPVGQLRPVVDYDGGTSCHATEEPTSYTRELYRLRTLPHLYDELDIKHATRMRAALMERAPRLRDYDCHTCHNSVLTDDGRCPYCGSARMAPRDI